MLDLVTQLPEVDGFYPNVPDRAYHQWDALGSSTLGDAATETWRSVSPKWRAQRSSSSMSKGSALHYLVLQPEIADRMVKPAPSGVGMKAKKEAMIAENPWVILLGPQDYDDARYMAESVLEDPYVGPIVAAAEHRELAGVWTELVHFKDDQGELVEVRFRCRMRLDLEVPSVGIIDLKTARDVSDSGWMRACVRDRLDLQDVHYTRGAVRLGRPFQPFLFLLVKNDRPYTPRLVTVVGEAPAVSETQLDELYEEYGRCLHTGEWPGYPPRVGQIALPKYHTDSVRDWVEARR